MFSNLFSSKYANPEYIGKYMTSELCHRTVVSNSQSITKNARTHYSKYRMHEMEQLFTVLYKELMKYKICTHSQLRQVRSLTTGASSYCGKYKYVLYRKYRRRIHTEI